MPVYLAHLFRRLVSLCNLHASAITGGALTTFSSSPFASDINRDCVNINVIRGPVKAKR